MTWKARSGPCNRFAKAGPDPAGSNCSRQQLFQKHLPTNPIPARIIIATSTLTLLRLLMLHATAKALRCETEGQGTDWMQASPTEGWREWSGDALGAITVWTTSADVASNSVAVLAGSATY